MRRGKDPSDIFYVLLNIVLVVTTGVAFTIFASHVAKATSIANTTVIEDGIPVDQVSNVDFAGMGPSAAYAVLLLSWLATLLCE